MLILAIASLQTDTCEKISTDIVEKISEYGHSFTKGNLGSSFVAISNNSQTLVGSKSTVGNPDLPISLSLLSVV